MTRRLLSTFSMFLLFVTGAAFLGCGDSEKTGAIEDSAETKKADDIGKKAMQDYMKNGGPGAGGAKKKAY